MPADIVRLPVPAKPRTPSEIEAAMRVHLDALKALAMEMVAAQGGDPTALRPPVEEPDEVLSLTRAAHSVGWSPKTLRRHIFRHNHAHPNDPLAFQSGGLPNSPWHVMMPRLRRYRRNLPSSR